MNKITRYICLGLLAVSSMVAASHTSSDACDAPKGKTYRCYSENQGPIYPPGSGTFTIVDEKGCNVGYTTASTASNFKQKWVTEKGTMKIEIGQGATLFSSTPIQDAVTAFPEVAPYLTTNPDAEVWVFVGNHEKDAATTLAWKGTGEFKKCNLIEVRCVFLTLFENGTPYLHKCLGCYWTFNKSA